MNELPGNVLDAHGGMNHWNKYQKIEATIVTGGGFFAFKGLFQDPAPTHVCVVA